MPQRRVPQPAPTPETPRASPPIRAMNPTSDSHIFDYRGYGGPAGTFTITGFSTNQPSFFDSTFQGTFDTISGSVSATSASGMMQQMSAFGSLYKPTTTATVTVKYGWNVGSVGDWPRVSTFESSFSSSFQTTVTSNSVVSFGEKMPELMPLFVGPPAASPATKWGAVPAWVGNGTTPTASVYMRSPGNVSWPSAFALVNLYYFSISATNTRYMT